MAVTRNEALLRRLFSLYNKADIAAIRNLLSPSFVRHDLASVFPGVEGQEGVQSFLEELRRVLPDSVLEIQDVIVGGDRVVVRFVGSGTFLGEFRGIQPTGKASTWNGINIYRIQEGKVAETWQLGDFLGWLTQMGAVQPLV